MNKSTLKALKKLYTSLSSADIIGDIDAGLLPYFEKRRDAIRNAGTLEDLADALNFMCDTFDNGSGYTVENIYFFQAWRRVLPGFYSCAV